MATVGANSCSMLALFVACAMIASSPGLPILARQKRIPATRLDASVKSGAGAVHDEFDDDAAAPLKLTFRSGSGSATLKKAR